GGCGMLDARAMVDAPDTVKANLRRRNGSEPLVLAVDEVIALQQRRSDLIQERDGLRQRRNELSGQIGGLYKAGKASEAEALKGEVAAGTERTRIIEAELAEVEVAQQGLLLSFPNLL